MPELADIPGVLGPADDPIRRENKRLYEDPVVTVPDIKWKSSFNFVPILSSITYYAFELPATTLHNAFESLRAPKTNRFYHQQFRRVPEIWECGTEDKICVFEAESQFRRDKKVDAEIIKVIEQRKKVCMARAGTYGAIDCKHLLEQLEQCEQAWHVKYGDTGIHCNARNVLQKQKNRFIEDRYTARKQKPGA